MISDALAFRERDGELSASFGLSQPVNNDLSSRLITAFCSEQYHTLHLLPLPLYLSRFPAVHRPTEISARGNMSRWDKTSRADWCPTIKNSVRAVCPKINGEEAYGGFRSWFINDNVTMYLSYLRKYGEHRITVETLNRPFVLPHCTFSRCLSSVHTICQAFWTSEIVSFHPTGRHFSPNFAVQYPKNVSYYNFVPREKEKEILYFSLFQRYVEERAWTSIRWVFLYSSVCVSEQWHHGAMRKLNIAALWNFHNHGSVS